MKKILKSFNIYFSQRKREGISGLIYGGAIAPLIFQIIHNYTLFKEHAFLSAIVTVLISFLLFISDFLFFHFSGKQKIQNEINILNNVLKESLKIENTLVSETALNRVKKEIQILRKFNDNTLELESLQNYEYVRKIFSRILSDIMNRGDHYITLSNIDFWTMNPKSELDEFYSDNKSAIRVGKNIHRLIILDRQKYFSDNELDKEQKAKKERLKTVLTKMKQDMHIEITNYFDRFKTLCYLTSTSSKMEFDNLLPSVIVVKSNFKDVMLATVDNLEDMENSNSIIKVRHYKFETISKQDEKKFDIIKCLAEINIEIEKLQFNGSKSKELDLLHSVLQEYVKAFCELRHIYDTDLDGAKHKLVNSGNNSTIIKDIPMILNEWDKA